MAGDHYAPKASVQALADRLGQGHAAETIGPDEEGRLPGHFDWMKRAVSAPGRPGWDPALAGEAPFAYVLAVGVVLGLGCAALSWHLLERPLQRWKDLGRARPGALGGPNRAQ